MVNWTTKHQRELLAQKRERIKRYLTGPVWFLVGVIVTLFFQNWIVRLLPSPRTSAAVQGSRYSHGTGQGCIVYQVSLIANDPIDYSYMMIGFPGTIQDYQVGVPSQFLTPWGLDFRYTITAPYRNERGQCSIIAPVPLHRDESVMVSLGDNTLRVHTSKLPRMTAVSGIVVLDSYHLTMNSDRPYLEGEYEYTKMGLPVRKKLDIKYLGMADAK